MQVQVLASGSKGNCTIVSSHLGHILIDVGISYKTLCYKLSKRALTPLDLNAILITHAHKDHIQGLAVLLKKTSLKCYIPSSMYEELKSIIDLEHVVFIDDKFSLLDFNIELLYTSHDTNTSVAYIINNIKDTLVYITDTGYINRRYLTRMQNKSIYIIESNHDEKMLMEGPYPYNLKQRIISDRGHLSNKSTAGYLKQLVGSNTKYIILAHLSEQNNTEQLAYQETYNNIKDDNIKILVANQEVPTDLIVI